MISSLGHCEDPQCAKSSNSHDLVRLFRCSIHCDRLLCLFHLNAHNVYYEEEKKQNDAVLHELQNCLTLYQSIFEQQIQSYRELVHQASTLLLRNTSALVPIEQIRPVLEKLQSAITFFRQDKVIIKSETTLEITECEPEKIEMSLAKEFPPVKKEPNTPNNTRSESNQKVVVRLERIDYNKEVHLNRKSVDEPIKRNENPSTSKSSFETNVQCDKHLNVEEETVIRLGSLDRISSYPSDSIENLSHEEISQSATRIRKNTDEICKDFQELNQENKRFRVSSPISSTKKKPEKIRKKTEKPNTLKRLQT